MKLPFNLAIEINSKEDLIKASLICNYYGLYWSNINKIIPSTIPLFDEQKYLCFTNLFIDDCHKHIGYRLIIKLSNYNRKRISLKNFIHKYG